MAVLITGATRGLGLATARAARARGADVLVAGPDRTRTERAAAEVGGEPVVLDLTSLEGTRAVAAELPPLDAVSCNAGVQLPGALRLTPDGFEQTFQVNFLAHLALVDALPAVPRIVFIGSATHDPTQKLGLPAPPDDVSVERLAAGDTGAGRGAGRRRYTASKLLVTAAALALARERRATHISCVDPGLMLATGLSRAYPGPASRVMNLVAPVVSRLPTASTPERSAATVVTLLLDDPPPVASGAVLDRRGRPGPVSARAGDPAFQAEVLSVGRRLAAA